jgi:hypothetical protein
MNVATSSKEPTMTQRIPENFPAAEWRLVTIMGNTMPPRDPNDDDDDDDDDDEDEDNDTEPDDERQPPVVREPDEDE